MVQLSCVHIAQNELYMYSSPIAKSGPNFSICSWAKSQPVVEDVAYVTFSLIGWDLAQPSLANGSSLHLSQRYFIMCVCVCKLNCFCLTCVCVQMLILMTHRYGGVSYCSPPCKILKQVDFPYHFSCKMDSRQKINLVQNVFEKGRFLNSYHTRRNQSTTSNINFEIFISDHANDVHILFYHGTHSWGYWHCRFPIMSVFLVFSKLLCHYDNTYVVGYIQDDQGPYSLSGRTSYSNILWRLEAARFCFRFFQSLWNLIGTSFASRLRCLSYFRAIGSL